RTSIDILPRLSPGRRTISSMRVLRIGAALHVISGSELRVSSSRSIFWRKSLVSLGGLTGDDVRDAALACSRPAFSRSNWTKASRSAGGVGALGDRRNNASNL